MDRSPAELAFQQQMALEQSDPRYTNTGFDPRFDRDRQITQHNGRAAWRDLCEHRRAISGHRRPRSRLCGGRRRRPGTRRTRRATRAGPSDDSGEGEPASSEVGG